MTDAKKPEPEPTEADIERANAFFRLQAKMEAEEDDCEDDLALATEFAKVRQEARRPLLAEIAQLKKRLLMQTAWVVCHFGPSIGPGGPEVRADIQRRTLPPPRPTGPQC